MQSQGNPCTPPQLVQFQMLLLPTHRRRPPPRRAGAGRGVTGLHLRLAGCLLLLLLLLLLAHLVLLCSSSSSSRARCRRHHDQGILPDSARPRVTIFSATNAPPARQELAVRSWLALPGNVSVVLLGASPAAVDLSARLGRRVTLEAAVDSAFTGTPFFHSMLARAQAASDSDICVLVDADIVLLPQLVDALIHFSKVGRDWFLVAMSCNNNTNNFHHVTKCPVESSDNGIIMAWNNPGSPLHAGVMPSFLYGKGVHNSWLAHEILSSEMRLFFDATSLVLGLYPQTFSSSNNDRLPAKSWEFHVNRHLAAVYGSYCYQLLRLMNSTMLYQVVKQSEDYMVRKVDDLTSSNFVTDVEENVHGEEGPLQRKGNIFEASAPVDLPYSLSTLLELVADKNRSVVLAIAGASYRDMLMSWACRLRHLGVTNFIVCALDHETYEFSVLQGLPVFRDQLSPKNVSFDDCHFGTKCFQQVTKVKSRIVLKILRLGYNVLLSDVDVYWFRNPVPFLYSLGPATFGAQSDEYNETGPINLPRRLNSGFYFVRADNITITAMEMVVKHATNSGLSEQPSFYDVLCGKDGANRIGDDKCLEPNTSLAVVFLDRGLFPNGAYKGLWEKHDVRSICQEIGCFILHNNWINGRKKKLQRQMSSGLWDYDPSSRLCLQYWNDKSSFTVMGQFHLFDDTGSL